MLQVLIVYNVALTIIFLVVFYSYKTHKEQAVFWMQRMSKFERDVKADIVKFEKRSRRAPIVVRHQPRPKKHHPKDHIAHGHEHKFAEALKKL